MRAFLSYSAADKDAAGEFRKLLSNEGYDVWFADEALGPGDNWSLAIGKALEQSDVMIVLLSDSYLKSERVRQELEHALVSRQYAHRVIPVLLKPAKEIPWILRKFEIVDASKGLTDSVHRVVARLERLVATESTVTS